MTQEHNLKMELLRNMHETLKREFEAQRNALDLVQRENKHLMHINKLQEELLSKYRESKCPMDPTKIKEYNLGRLVILSVKHSEFIKKK